MVPRPRYRGREEAAGGVDDVDTGGQSQPRRAPYKRTAHGVVVTLRRPYKRITAPPPPAKVDVKPEWLRSILLAGQMRCPRKWADLSLELCVQIQEASGSLCVEARCRCYGPATAAAFRADVAAARAVPPAKRLTIVE